MDHVFHDKNDSDAKKQNEEEEEEATTGTVRPVRRGRNCMPMEKRPEFGITVMEESAVGITKDITVVHSDWKNGKKGPGVELFVPGPKRLAAAWQVVHTYFALDGAEMFVCNICGKDLKLSGTSGAIYSHLKRRHPDVMDKLDEVERKEQTKLQNKRKHDDLLLGSTNKFHTAPTMTVPFQPDVQPRPPNPLPPPPASTLPRSKSVRITSTSLRTKPGAKAVERKLLAIQAQKEAQIMYLIGEGLNFAHAESHGHKRLLETALNATRLGASPNHLELSSKDARTRVFVAARKLRERLKERIKGKDLCASANHWTSRQSITYVSLSVQWIEDFHLESAVLAVSVLRNKQKLIKESLLQDFEAKLHEWDLNSSVSYIVTDREGNFNVFGRAIENIKGSERIPCLDYLLNLVAVKAFEGVLGVGAGEDLVGVDQDDSGDNAHTDCGEDEPICDSKRAVSKKGLLPKVRKLVGHFESSIQASDELMVIAKQLCGSEEERESLKSLAPDVNTAWWSTQNMLERLFGLREAITTYVGRKWMPGATSKENRPPRLTEEEWEALEELHLMLRPLRFAEQILQSQRSITSSFVPLVVHLIYQELETIHTDPSNTVSVKAIAKEMLVTMQEHFGNSSSRESSSQTLATSGTASLSEVRIHKAILMAHALDPRFKLLSVFPQKIQAQIWADLLDEMIQLGPSIAPEDPEDDASNTKDRKEDAGRSELSSLFQLYSAKQNEIVRRKVPKGEFDVETWKHNCEYEIKQYRETKGMEPKMDSNALRQWWAAEYRRFPILWRLAQRVLSINATSAPSYRAFCKASSLSIHVRCTVGSGDEIMHFLHENFRWLEEERIWDEVS